MLREMDWFFFFKRKKSIHVYANSSFDDDRNQFVRRKQALPHTHTHTEARTQSAPQIKSNTKLRFMFML